MTEQEDGRAKRLELARGLCDAILRAHGAAVVAVGLHGSLARGDDGPASDIDLVVVTAPGGSSRIASRVLRREGITVDVGVIDEPAYLAEAGSLAPRWPLAAEQYLVHRALYDPTGHFERLRAAHEELLRRTSDERFVAAGAPHVLAALDHAAKARLIGADERVGALRHVWSAALAAAVALGFLQRRYYRNADDAIGSLPRVGPAEARSDFAVALASIDVAEAIPSVERAVGAVATHARARGAMLEAASIGDLVI